MQSVQVGELKARFSSILEQVRRNSEEYIVEYGKNHDKVPRVIRFASHH